ncbi:MAG: DUF3015 family protein [Desulfococcaceae bacterium]
MKKLLVAFAILAMTAAPALAVPPSNCGCGIGTMVFEGQDGLASQVLAATTNGIFGNQTFGISTGTLGCDRPAAFVQNEEVNRFVSENMDNLAVDIATGQGESLDALSEMIRVPSEKRTNFNAALQANFETIYPTPQVTHDHVVEQIAAVYAQI